MSTVLIQQVNLGTTKGAKAIPGIPAFATNDPIATVTLAGKQNLGDIVTYKGNPWRVLRIIRP